MLGPPGLLQQDPEDLSVALQGRMDQSTLTALISVLQLERKGTQDNTKQPTTLGLTKVDASFTLGFTLG
jgi:hypothetical protein